MKGIKNIGLTVLCALLTLAFLSGCAGFKGVRQMTPQEAHAEAGEGLKIATVAIGVLYVTDAIDQEQFAALEALLEQGNKMHSLVGEAIEAVERARESGNAVEAIMAYQEAYLKSKAVLDELDKTLREKKK